jgi:hypothetical protein
MASRLTRFESSGFLPVGSHETPVYVDPVENEKALHGTVDVCQTIRNYPVIFARMRRSITRCVEAFFESHGGHFENLL